MSIIKFIHHYNYKIEIFYYLWKKKEKSTKLIYIKYNFPSPIPLNEKKTLLYDANCKSFHSQIALSDGF